MAIATSAPVDPVEPGDPAADQHQADRVDVAPATHLDLSHAAPSRDRGAVPSTCRAPAASAAPEEWPTASSRPVGSPVASPPQTAVTKSASSGVAQPSRAWCSSPRETAVVVRTEQRVDGGRGPAGQPRVGDGVRGHQHPGEDVVAARGEPGAAAHQVVRPDLVGHRDPGGRADGRRSGQAAGTRRPPPAGDPPGRGAVGQCPAPGLEPPGGEVVRQHRARQPHRARRADAEHRHVAAAGLVVHAQPGPGHLPQRQRRPGRAVEQPVQQRRRCARDRSKAHPRKPSGYLRKPFSFRKSSAILAGSSPSELFFLFRPVITSVVRSAASGSSTLSICGCCLSKSARVTATPL